MHTSITFLISSPEGSNKISEIFFDISKDCIEKFKLFLSSNDIEFIEE